MDKSILRKDIDLSVLEIHNAVDSLGKGPNCRGEDDGTVCTQTPSVTDFWDWFFDWA